MVKYPKAAIYCSNRGYDICQFYLPSWPCSSPRWHSTGISWNAVISTCRIIYNGKANPMDISSKSKIDIDQMTLSNLDICISILNRQLSSDFPKANRSAKNPWPSNGHPRTRNMSARRWPAYRQRSCQPWCQPSSWGHGPPRFLEFMDR